jgi:hypothetical protein
MPHSSVKPGAVDLSLEDLLGLLDSSQARPHDNAPDMPVPNLNRSQGAPLPQMPMAGMPQFDNPLSGRNQGGNPWLLNALKKEYPQTFDPSMWFGSGGGGPGPLPNPSGFAESFGGPLGAGGGGAGGGGAGGFSMSSMGPMGWAAMIAAGKGLQAQDPDSFMGKALHGLLGPSISQGLAGIKENPLTGLLNLGLGPLQGFTPWGKKARRTDPEWMGLGK